MAIVFAHEIHIFIPKFGQNSNFITKSTEGGSVGLGIIPKKTVFLVFPLFLFPGLVWKKGFTHECDH